jgi:2-keto-4-pentenoate hydratase/2-oxohepta-3-ene-1,7-dioic acid hydratase in catechol pathway
MLSPDPAAPAPADPAGVVLAQAGRVDEAAAPWLVSGDRALPMHGWARSPCAQASSVTELVQRWDRFRLDLQTLLENPSTAEQIAHHGTPTGGLRLQAPLRPGQVFCTIGNYRRQVVEAAVDAAGPADAQARRMATLHTLAQRRRDGDPYVCLTSPDRVGRPGGPLVLPAGVDTLDWEIEIGAVIGGSGSHLAPQRAGGSVAGYCVANDLTIRARVARPDLPALGSDWLQSKGMRGSLPMGPYFVPSWQIPDPGRLRLRLTLNGATMQDDTAGDMLFGIDEQLAYLSRHTRLRPGDLLCTGSPAGFGSHHGRYLRPGDVIRASITGLGEQVKFCVDQAVDQAVEQAEHRTAVDLHRTPQMEPAP